MFCCSARLEPAYAHHMLRLRAPYAALTQIYLHLTCSMALTKLDTSKRLMNIMQLQIHKGVLLKCANNIFPKLTLLLLIFTKTILFAPFFTDCQYTVFLI